jgi:hypothetical protein
MFGFLSFSSCNPRLRFANLNREFDTQRVVRNLQATPSRPEQAEQFAESLY